MNAAPCELAPRARWSFGFDLPSLLYLEVQGGSSELNSFDRSTAMARSEKTKLMEDILREKREEILRIAEKHGARNVRVFGSVATGDATNTSDIDLLVDTAEETSPWFPAGLAAELEELLGQRVDVVTTNGLYWLLRRRILKEARPL